MLNRNCSIIICICICFLFPVSGFSQFFYYYSNPFAFTTQVSRYTVGYNTLMVTGEYNGLVPLYNNAGVKVGDTVFTRTLTSAGNGYAIGTTLPIARMGRRSSYDLSIDFQYNSYSFFHVNGGVKRSGEDYTSGFDPDGTTVTTQMALPLSIDYKWGSDAIAKRTTRFGFVLGAGGIPQYNSTVSGLFKNPLRPDVIEDKSVLGVTPFVKAEFSAYVFFCFRLKAFYSIGNIPLIEGQNLSETSGQTVPAKFSAKSQLTISMCVLPLSFLWYKERRSHGWWDDYESEEAMWRKK